MKFKFITRHYKKSRWRLAFNTIPFIVIVIIAKYIAHYYNLQFLNLNSLFTAVISANIFLIGFLITGTLSDFKESEKLPGDLSNSLSSLFDEAYITYQNKKDPVAKKCMEDIFVLNQKILDWFYKNVRNEEVYSKIFSLNNYFLEFEKLTQANFIVKMKNEQSNLRRLVTRIHTIRETSFLGTAYAIAEIITFIMIVGFIFLDLNPFYESMFFVSFVSFIMVYMIFFIRELDNPFSYYEKDGLVEEVSLKPIEDSQRRMSLILNELETDEK